MKTTRALALFAVIGGIALLAGCSGGFAPTLPSPGGGGIRITTSDGDRLYTTNARADGSYTLSGVPAGARVISASAAGFHTSHTLVNAAGAITGTANLVALEGAGPTQVPVIRLNEPVVDTETGVATISGNVTNLDSNAVVLIQNGQEPTIVAVAGGAFEVSAVLDSGANTIRIRATNAVGSTITPAITLNFGGEFYFRVTLAWDSRTDIDLHNWSPTGGHSFYENQTIDAGSLDVDNTNAYGPENFTCINLVPGRYRVGVDFYDENEDASARCNIRVVSGAMAPGAPVKRVFGPYELTVFDKNRNYPVTGNTASWWRPCDIILSATGEVSVVPADTSVALPLGVALSAAKVK